MTEEAKLVAFAGRKSSGKTTCVNIVHGYVLKEIANIVSEWNLTEEGRLMVPATFQDENGKPYQDWGVLDVLSEDPEVLQYLSDNVWKYVRGFAFATPLKRMLNQLLDIDKPLLYGSEKDKNEFTQYKWRDMPGVIITEQLVSVQEILDCSFEEAEEFCGSIGLVHKMDTTMTGRESMEYIGSNIFRRMYSKVWLNGLLKEFLAQGSKYSVVGDCRQINEVEGIQEAGGKVIYLKRRIDDSEVKSESELDDYTVFDAVLDNRDWDMSTLVKEVVRTLQELEFLPVKATVGA